MHKTDISLISRHHDMKFMADAHFVKNEKAKPVIIFNHGFKGFKDWGPFDRIAEIFAEAGFVFIKMNFSHNGIGTENPMEFMDLEAFAQNNFSIELDDTEVLVDILFSENPPVPKVEMDLDKLYLLGHSRGGASVILKASEDARIKGVVTWAAVNDLENWYSKDELEYWKKQKRIYILNGRTNQQMPMDYQLVENFLENKDRLDVPKSVKNMQKPMLTIHGTADTTVPVSAVKEIGSWNPKVRVEIIDGADHTFGGGHPFEGDALPADLKKVVDLTMDFYTSVSSG